MADTWLTIEQAAVALGLSVRTVNRHIVAGKIQSRLNEGRREVLVDMPDPASDASSDFPTDEIGAAIDAAAASPFAASRVTVDSRDTADYARRVSDFARQASDQVRQASEGTLHSPDQPQGFDPNTVLALADNAAEKAELAISAYQALARATDTQFRHVRRSARAAWASVAVMAAGVAVAVGWTTHYLTKAQVEGSHLRQQVRQVTEEANYASAERNTLRTELTAAREQAARAEGQVTALSDTQARLEARAEARQAATTMASATSTDTDPLPPATRPTTRPTSFVQRLTSLLSEKTAD